MAPRQMAHLASPRPRKLLFAGAGLAPRNALPRAHPANARLRGCNCPAARRTPLCIAGGRI
eukprot:5459153-Lingulodinium_polyedra.AAC.1